MKKDTKIDAGKKLETVKDTESSIAFKGAVLSLLRKLKQITRTTEQEQAAKPTTKPVAFNIGLDLGDKRIRYCILDH